MLFGIPDGAESFDGATTDDDKIQKVWTAVDANPATVVFRSHRRLGRAIKLQRIVFSLKVHVLIHTGETTYESILYKRRLKTPSHYEHRRKAISV